MTEKDATVVNVRERGTSRRISKVAGDDIKRCDNVRSGFGNVECLRVVTLPFLCERFSVVEQGWPEGALQGPSLPLRAGPGNQGSNPRTRTFNGTWGLRYTER
jgi:hypothetical protein